MFTLIGAYMKILTAALGWGSFLCFGMLGGKFRLTALCCIGYAIGFWIVRFFLPELYFGWMPVIAVLVATGSTVWSNYEDKKNGKRWCNW